MKRSLAFILAAWLVACGVLPNVADETKGWSADKLYKAATDEINDKNWEKAIKYFEVLEARYPYGRYAQQAQVEIAYAYWKQGETASALAACDRFIRLHPDHPNVDYVYYLKGLINFNEDLGILGNLSGQDLTERDPKASRDAFDTFKELVTRFPDSRYTPDATQRMKYLVNALAYHEVHVARFYYSRGAYVAAANRAKTALTLYPQSPATEEAILIMVKSYDQLGLNDLRDDAERVMVANFPNSKYLASKDKSDKPWWKLW